jgi:periplasmic divalent cation tolerance protein
MELRLCYITASSKDEAKAIGRALVEKRLAACVNLLDGMESLYWWEGKIESSQECVLIAKTEKRLVEPLIAMVKALHSYSIPCVLELEVGRGNEAYLQWLAENLR